MEEEKEYFTKQCQVKEIHKKNRAPSSLEQSASYKVAGNRVVAMTISIVVRKVPINKVRKGEKGRRPAAEITAAITAPIFEKKLLT